MDAMGGIDGMYREYILDHGMNPRNKGIVQPADLDHEESNPLCGDRLRLTAQIDDQNIIRKIGWDGDGCAISQAAASLLGEQIIGKSLDEVAQITREDVLELIGIPLTMNRVKCALLSLKVLHGGLNDLGHSEHTHAAGEKD
ncbi:MAG TPA: iron-sulfur cluster assembly scaffold protein [Phototrophicaceae bacterium]|jgi:nitrogen fixation NifU-like protein|nr:iron-sulfur cluster assembly scaffold protein [Phototrophicaceae bacterium]